jgi:hypothetical protein
MEQNVDCPIRITEYLAGITSTGLDQFYGHINRMLTSACPNAQRTQPTPPLTGTSCQRTDYVPGERIWGHIVRRASEYWSCARECEHWATKIADGQDRKIFFDMAKVWVELALKEQSAFKIDRATRTIAIGALLQATHASAPRQTASRMTIGLGIKPRLRKRSATPCWVAMMSSVNLPIANDERFAAIV